jgi:hypothetical protein
LGRSMVSSSILKNIIHTRTKARITKYKFKIETTLPA